VLVHLVPLVSDGGPDGIEKAAAGRVVGWSFHRGYDVKDEVRVGDELSLLHDPKLVSSDN